jgi:hypothetical protein
VLQANFRSGLDTTITVEDTCQMNLKTLGKATWKCGVANDLDPIRGNVDLNIKTNRRQIYAVKHLTSVFKSFLPLTRYYGISCCCWLNNTCGRHILLKTKCYCISPPAGLLFRVCSLVFIGPARSTSSKIPDALLQGFPTVVLGRQCSHGSRLYKARALWPVNFFLLLDGDIL